MMHPVWRLINILELPTSMSKINMCGFWTYVFLSSRRILE